MSCTPRVTLLLPVYNSESYLAEAVESLLGQTYTDFELLAIDDGSTDSSAAILAGYDDPRMRLAPNPRNLGLVATLNRGLELARGEYVARMDADDIAAPARLARQVDYLDAHPGVAVVGTHVVLINAAGQRFSSLLYPADPGVIRDDLIAECSLVHPSVMFRKDVVRTVGGYRADARNAEDYELWLRLADSHQLANLAEPLLSYRMHPKQVSGQNLAAQHRMVQGFRDEALSRRAARGENVEALKRVVHPGWFARLAAAPCTLGGDYLHWHRQYRDMQRYPAATALGLRALRHCPLSGEAWGSTLGTAIRAAFPRTWLTALRWYRAKMTAAVSRRA